jgi:multiple antibiotic resistance protein
VPYLLNPAGIATLVIVSDDIDSLLMGVVVIGVVLLVGAIDFAIFRNMDKLAKHLDPSRLAITEAVFGVLLAALAVQLMVDGLANLGVITAVAH